MVRPVPTSRTSAGPAAVAAYDVEGAGRPRVGHEEGGVAERVRRPVVARLRQPGGEDHGVGDEHVAVVGGDDDAGAVARSAARRAPGGGAG